MAAVEAMASMSTEEHDALFQLTFSTIEHASTALRTLLPAAIVAASDFSTLVLEPGSFTDPKLTRRRSDLLFSMTLRGKKSLVFVLFEHQSTSDPLMLLRLLEYMTRIWRAHLAKHARARRLPPILPVVLHHSKRGWHAPRCFDELLDLDAETLELVKDLVPRFRIVLDDISRADDTALLRRPMTTLGRVVLFLLRHAWNREGLFDELGRVKDLLVEVAGGRDGGGAITAILIYLQKTTGKDEEQVGMALQNALGESAYEQIMNAYEQAMNAPERAKAKGRQEGLRQGLEKGLRQGLEKGLRQGLERGLEQGLERQRAMMLRQLGLRFGELPGWAQDQVSAADADALDRIAERVLSASSLVETLGPSSKAERPKAPRKAPRRRGLPR